MPSSKYTYRAFSPTSARKRLKNIHKEKNPTKEVQKLTFFIAYVPALGV